LGGVHSIEFDPVTIVSRKMHQWLARNCPDPQATVLNQPEAVVAKQMER